MLIRALVLLGLALLFFICLPLARNIQIAKATGLKFVVVPCYNYSNMQFVMRPVMKEVLKVLSMFLSEPGPASWRRLAFGIWPLKLRHAPFAVLASDTFLTVAPGGIILNTANASVIDQVLARGWDFPKPVWIYRAIAIYGDSVVSAGGKIWKKHRKLASLAFGESNNRLVWQETLRYTTAMLTGLHGHTVSDVAQATTRLSLEVLGTAVLGHRMELPATKIGVEPYTTAPATAESSSNGHTMSFFDSLDCIARNVANLAAIMKCPVPKRLLVGSWSKSYAAYDNWGQYMREMLAEKKKSNTSGGDSSSVDLISLLVREQTDGSNGKNQPSSALTDSEVLGNLFIFIIAGHETTSSSLHMTLVLLALYPSIQKDIQKELAEIFQGRPPSEWDYEEDLPRLLDSLLNAAWQEEMRLISPILSIPKVVCKEPQQLDMDGNLTTIPANTIIRLCIPSVHVNPNFWPHGEPADRNKPIFTLDNTDNDLEEFKPKRWMKQHTEADNRRGLLTEIVNSSARPPDKSGSSKSKEHGQTKTTDSNSNSSNDSAPRLWTPQKGAYVPFSDGQRQCLGKRFAQVEILAALAIIFSSSSVELAVDEWATDEAVEQMSNEGRKAVWNLAFEKGKYNWQNKLTCNITVQLAKDGFIPLRFVRRGEERFFDL